jgi:hypothetical protein
MVEKRQQKGPECNNSIKNQNLRQWLRLEGQRAFKNTTRQTLGLEIVKQVVGISIKLQEVSDLTVWSGRPSPK